MQNRKVLTLQEVLELERQPTLQEMVDLSLEDYAKYLYEKGIIDYAPEILVDYCKGKEYKPSYDVVLNSEKKYYIPDDIIILINDMDYTPMFDKREYLDKDDKINEYYEKLFNIMHDDFNLYESEQWNNPNIIEKGTIYFRHNVEVEYSIDNENKVTLYEKNTEGKYWNPTSYPHELYYLENLKE